MKKIRTEIITEKIEIKDVYCDFCGDYIGKQDVNDCVWDNSGRSAREMPRVFITQWMSIKKDICRKCVEEKEKKIKDLCEQIGFTIEGFYTSK